MQPLASGLVFGHQLLPARETAQDGPKSLPGHGGGQLEPIPSLDKVEGSAVDSYCLKPAWIGLFLDPAAGVVRLALGDTELRLAVFD